MRKTANTERRQYSLDIFIIVASVVVFYPELFFGISASLTGDHWEQHYPWAKLMASSVKKFQIPYWTSLIQCGFPIVAEGQIGAFYPLHWLIYGILPFKLGYAYQNLLHFMISGCGTYAYARRLGLTRTGALLSAFVFLYGTGYGGAYYNITSLKTLAWFPWALWAIDSYQASNKLRYPLLFTVFVYSALNAGYLQVALFTLLIIAVYLVLRVIISPEQQKVKISWLRMLIGFGLATAAGFLLSYPQLALTFDLAGLSTRANMTKEYAYVGSMSPLTMVTMIIPTAQWFFRGNSLYCGLVPLILAPLSYFSLKKQSFRLWFWLTIIAFAFSLGRWALLYPIFINLTKIYAFRTPVKFIIFVLFGMAILSGLGLDYLTRHDSRFQRARNTAGRIFIGISAGAAGIFVIIYSAIVFARPIVLQAGDWFISRYFHNKPGHTQPFEVYHDRLIGLIEFTKKYITRPDAWQLWGYVLILVHMILAVWLIREKLNVKRWMLAACCLLALDLYSFSWRDIRWDFARYSDLPVSSAAQYLTTGKSAGALGRIYGYRPHQENLRLIPSVNMLHGIEDIGGYSPLIFRKYFEAVGIFGNINDSNYSRSPSVQDVLSRLPILNFLNVTHILSAARLEHDGLKLEFHDPQSGVMIYRNEGAKGKAYFINRLRVFNSWEELRDAFNAPGFDPTREILFERQDIPDLLTPKVAEQLNAKSGNENGLILNNSESDMLQTWNVKATRPCFFVIADTIDRHWTATMNGASVAILPAYGLFKAIWLPEAGEYHVAFKYEPFLRNK